MKYYQGRKMSGANGRRPVFGLIMILISGLCWSSITVLSKVGIESGMDAITLNTGRMVIGSTMVFLFLLFFRKGAFVVKPKTLIPLAIFGLLDYTVGGILFIGSLHYIDASLAFLVLYIYPALVVITSIFSGKEKFSLTRLLAVVLTFAGVALVLETGMAVKGSEWLGVLFVFGAAVIFTFYLLFAEKVLETIRASTMSFYTLFFGGLGMIIVAFFEPLDLSVIADPGRLAIIAYLGIVSTALALVLFMVGVRHVGASKAAIITTVEPVFVVLIAGVFLGEHLSLMQWLGVALQLTGVLLVHQEPQPLPEPAP